jgi:hypothetical protein
MKDLLESIKYGLTHNVPYLTVFSYIILFSSISMIVVSLILIIANNV